MCACTGVYSSAQEWRKGGGGAPVLPVSRLAAADEGERLCVCARGCGAFGRDWLHGKGPGFCERSGVEQGGGTAPFRAFLQEMKVRRDVGGKAALRPRTPEPLISTPRTLQVASGAGAPRTDHTRLYSASGTPTLTFYIGRSSRPIFPRRASLTPRA
jgi:hypothetical protein